MANDLAGNGTLGAFDPNPQLFSGEADIVTDSALALTNQNLAKYTVVAKNAAGKLVPWAPAASDGTENAVGILAQAINTTAGGTNADTMVPFYIGGVFNPLALVWPVAADTLAERVAAFERTNISIRTLL